MLSGESLGIIGLKNYAMKHLYTTHIPSPDADFTYEIEPVTIRYVYDNSLPGSNLHHFFLSMR